MWLSSPEQVACTRSKSSPSSAQTLGAASRAASSLSSHPARLSRTPLHLGANRRAQLLWADAFASNRPRLLAPPTAPSLLPPQRGTELIHFAGDTPSFRSLLYLEQHRTAGRTSTEGLHRPPPPIDRYLHRHAAQIEASRPPHSITQKLSRRPQPERHRGLRSPIHARRSHQPHPRRSSRCRFRKSSARTSPMPSSAGPCTSSRQRSTPTTSLPSIASPEPSAPLASPTSTSSPNRFAAAYNTYEANPRSRRTSYSSATSWRRNLSDFTAHSASVREPAAYLPTSASSAPPA